MSTINTHLSIITLSINGLTSPIKRHRLAEQIKKQRSISVLCVKNSCQLKINAPPGRERMGKSTTSRWTKKQAGVAILATKLNKLQTNLKLTRLHEEISLYAREQLTKKTL